MTEELERGESGITEHVRAMRRACRKFLAVVEKHPDVVQHGGSRGHWGNWVFNTALGEMRGLFGVQLAQLAAKHGLDIEDDLAVILPPGDEGEAELDERDLRLLGP